MRTLFMELVDRKYDRETLVNWMKVFRFLKNPWIPDQVRDDEKRPLSTACQTVQAIQAVQALFWSFDRLVFVPASFD